jgi:hypothetical protein
MVLLELLFDTRHSFKIMTKRLHLKQQLKSQLSRTTTTTLNKRAELRLFRGGRHPTNSTNNVSRETLFPNTEALKEAVEKVFFRGNAKNLPECITGFF